MQVIYKLFWAQSEKLYVGKAISLKERVSQHIKELRNNSHYNYKLQEQFNLYGDPEASILEVCEDSDVFEREKFWINTLKAQSEGLNLMGEQATKNQVWAVADTKSIVLDSNFKHALIDEKNQLYQFNSIADFCRGYAKDNGFEYSTAFSNQVGKVLRGVSTSQKGLRKYDPKSVCKMKIKKQYVFCENGVYTKPYTHIIDYCREHPVFKENPALAQNGLAAVSRGVRKAYKGITVTTI